MLLTHSPSLYLFKLLRTVHGFLDFPQVDGLISRALILMVSSMSFHPLSCLAIDDY